MSKQKIAYVCNNCGASTSTWSGKCFTCSEWNTLEESVLLGNISKQKIGNKLKTQSISTAIKRDVLRLKTGMQDIDQVLGGGFVPSSMNLIAGQPGIGKSTLLLQLANSLAQKYKILYVSGEESAHQIGIRASRIHASTSSLELATTTSANDIAATISSNVYDLIVVDSIQTMLCDEISASAGNISQITNSARLFMSAAKSAKTAVVLVGHVTKEGTIAGPKILEHVVDVVLQMDGDRYGGFKIVRAVKNRYGSTEETGIFEMNNKGLSPVENPSAALLAERQVSDGSVVLATMEGSRPLLVEVQALVNKTSFGYPKRTASGIDLNRLNLLVAMLEKRTKLNLQDKDIYLNIVGGVKISETASDLAICMAIGSATKGLKMNKDSVVFGEVGLSGEVRHIPNIDKRVAEAKKLGFKSIIGPKLKTASWPGYEVAPDIKTTLNKHLVKEN